MMKLPAWFIRKPALCAAMGMAGAGAGMVLLTAPGDAPDDGTQIRFRKLALERGFFCEGAHAGDFNRDGAMDVVSGPYWYEGPDFERRRAIYKPAPFDPKSYSQNFLTFTHDVDGDGWTDVFVVGFPGAEASWFANPRGGDGLWERHVVFDLVDNESPTLTDLVGDEAPELVFHTGGRYGYATPDPADPRAKWIFHPISEAIAGGRFQHGLGVGDVNGDGRMDVLSKDGWLEQPESLEGDPLWKWHEFPFAPAQGGAQMYAYDFDGDGDNDVLTSLEAHGYGLVWHEQRPGPEGAPEFRQHVIVGRTAQESPYEVVYTQMHSIDLKDIDGDGVKDIVTGKRFWAHNGNDPGGNDPAVLYWFRTERQGEPGKVDFIPHFIDDDSGVGTQVLAEDVNGDGLLDIVVGNKKGTTLHLQQRPATDEEGFVSLFDGKTLTGWDGDPRFWKVEDGALTGEWDESNAPEGNTFLLWRGGKVADFHLKATYRISGAPNGNSGIQFRSQDQGNFTMKGYQAGLASGPASLGRIFDEHGRALLAERGTRALIAEDGNTSTETFAAPAELMRHVRAGDWNTCEIIASGENITLRVNGKVMSELVDRQTGERDLYGMLGFQLHRMAPEKAQYKDIRLKQLPGGTHRIDVSTLERTAQQGGDEPAHAGLSPAAATRAMSVPDGFAIDLLAAEPGLRQPIAFTFDERGRIWVVEGNTYPRRAPEGRGRDRVLVFEDGDGDGTFETRRVFLENLNLVSGIEVGFGGVWLGAAPYLLFVPDRDGDAQPDGPAEALLDGWGYEDTHETLNSFIWGPDGWLYGCHGIFTHSRVGSPGTPDADRVPLNCAYWRFHPVRREFEVFAHGTSNPWGLDFDEHGQAFATACVIPHFWHVIQGAYYLRQSNPLGHFNRYVYQNIETIADHVHYIGETPHAGNDVSDAAGGGHAHCGLMLYYGDAFPEEHRGRALFFNVHGHRINQEETVRSGSGFVARHLPDLVNTHDDWFMGVALKGGPDGNVYFIDWHDEQTCHRPQPEVWDRTNGRLYRLRYGDWKGGRLDLAARTDLELAESASARNGWEARTARRLLQERAAEGRLGEEAVRRLKKGVQEGNEAAATLSALWALHGAEKADRRMLEVLLEHREEYVRAWAIQLLLERPGSRERELPARLAALSEDPSPVVRLYLASALQRLPVEERWDLAARLAGRGEDASDHNLPQMIWYGTEPLVAADPVRALRIAAEARIPLVARLITRRATELDSGIAAVLETALAASDAEFQRVLLEELSNGLRGRAGVAPPAIWEQAYRELERIGDPGTAALLEGIAVAFGDARVFPRLRTVLTDRTASPERRKQALDILLRGRDAELVPLLYRLLEDEAWRLDAIRALGKYGDPGKAERLLERYQALDAEEKAAAVNALTGRREEALALLAAVEQGTVPRADVPAFAARQMLSLDDDLVTARVAEVWGKVSGNPEEVEAEMARYRAQLSSGALEKADAAQGRIVYGQVCGSCHVLFGEGQEIGPDLTGSNRADLDYLLENVLNPNAVVGKDYQLQVFTLRDGRVVSGMVRAESDSAFTVRLLENEEVVAKQDIVERQSLEVSMMPAGLLASLSGDDVRNLVAYLGSPGQVPLPGEAGAMNLASGRIEGAIEGEDLRVARIEGGSAAPQVMGGFPDDRWSGNAQLWWTGGKPGQSLELGFPVEGSGRYEVLAVLTKAVDYGIVQLSVDDAEPGEPLDMFEPGRVLTSGMVSVGIFDLGAGEHRLKATLAGRNPKSAPGYMFGLDCLVLKPVAAATGG
ncbi:MAG TPA: PVC-type heme-binding CxxCH protein [Verrucomicrobiales bacterium]|nr:PVC-type heme-binding CxxCH protein [Verrucomicrobiales bacterium]